MKMDNNEETEIFSFRPLRRIKDGRACSTISSVTHSDMKKIISSQRTSKISSRNHNTQTQSKNSNSSPGASTVLYGVKNKCLKNTFKTPMKFSKPAITKKQLFVSPDRASVKNCLNSSKEAPHVPSNLNLSSQSSSSNLSESILNNREKVPNMKCDIPVICLDDSTNEDETRINSESNLILPNIKLSNDDVDQDDFCPETVADERIESQNRVEGWLSSVPELSLQSAEVITKGLDDASNDINDSSSFVESSKIESKQCIHLHYHITESEMKQSKIKDYFKSLSSSTSKSNNNKGVNHIEVVKKWEGIMKSLRKPDSSIKSSSRSEVVPTSTNIKRTCPFYKRIQDTSFVVDAFSYGEIKGITAYFLTHFHYDHYCGLTKNFKGRLFCGHITANLLRLKLKVPDSSINVLPLDVPKVIEDVEVTLFDANHCPGAVMFLFKLRSGKVMLHVGDFRANPEMENINALWNHSIDLLYLDNTYLDPRYDFISQEESLSKCVDITKKHVELNANPLFVVGSYTIGKERVLKAIAAELDCKVFAPTPKRSVLLALNDAEVTARLTADPRKANVHVLPMKQLTPFSLRKYLDSVSSFSSLIALRPTGWEHSDGDVDGVEPKVNGNIYIYGVPYSEHSSFLELKRFVQYVIPKKILATVPGGDLERQRFNHFTKRWLNEANEIFLQKH